MIIDDLDLRILKGITSNKVNALTFAYKYDQEVFSNDVQKFSKGVIDYVKTFRAPPTANTLKESNKFLDPNLIDDIFDQIAVYDYNLNEYSFDVSKIKRRFQERAVEEIKEKVADDISDKPEDFVKKISLEIQRIVALDLERTFTQKTAAEFSDEFLDRYDARNLNPEIGREIKTGFSMFDALTGGIAPAELIMIGGQSNAGKALDITTPIATPNGWTTMGDIKVGDLVFGDDGKPTKVIATSGVMHDRECYELIFSDGEKIIADSNHTWRVSTFKGSQRNQKLKETNQLSSGLYVDSRQIVNIYKTSSVPVQCIQVDNDSHMFLAGRAMIPTHNSMLLNAFAKNIWQQSNTIYTPSTNFQKGYNIMYFSLEMPHEDCYVRFLASLANVDYRKLGKSQLSYEEKTRIDLASEFIKNYEKAGYYFDIIDVPRNLTIDELELRYHDALLKYRPDVVVVDYMGLMQASDAFNKEPDWLKLGAISASLHEFGRAYDVSVVTAGQLTDLKRSSQSSAAEESKAVGMHRWGRSSLIMHHVNVAIQIETRNNEKLYPDLKIHLVKNRKGPLGEGSLIKNFANASLIDVPFDEKTMPGDISDNVQDLIRQLQEESKKEQVK